MIDNLSLEESVERRMVELSASEQFDAARLESRKLELATVRTELTLALENVRMGFDTVSAVDAIQRMIEVLIKSSGR